jgi:hypothetical protein
MTVVLQYELQISEPSLLFEENVVKFFFQDRIVDLTLKTSGNATKQILRIDAFSIRISSAVLLHHLTQDTVNKQRASFTSQTLCQERGLFSEYTDEYLGPFLIKGQFKN